MGLLRKKNPRRDRLRRDLSAGQQSPIANLLNANTLLSIGIWLLFVLFCVPILSFEYIQKKLYTQTVSLGIIIVLLSLVGAIYVYLYQKRLLTNHLRASTLAGMFIFLLVLTKVGFLISEQQACATAAAVVVAIILSLAYERRFALGMSLLYCVFAYLVIGPEAQIGLLLTMAAGIITCCLLLKEIRTGMKLLEVSTLAAIVVFIVSTSCGFLDNTAETSQIFSQAGMHSLATLFFGLILQGLRPLIEKMFHITTSMTLLDYSDANQPLLKRLAMEAPGTYSHSLLVGAIAESAANAIDRNGLLCRVGAYYHDIGKIPKSSYFVENEINSSSRHKELSPAMSQLIITGHVKDGIEMAKEYKLPPVLRQFIETHHGTTLVEYFYHEARKKQSEKENAPEENEFRYVGPKPRTKEAAIVMISDACEGAVRALPEAPPAKVENVVHSISMKRLQDGQFDESNLSLRDLNRIEKSISKSLAAHYHARIPYPKTEQ